MQKRVFASLAALTLGLSACGTGVAPAISTGFDPATGASLFSAPHKAGQKKWTVLIHMAADNNLYRFGLEDLNEMEAGLKSDDVNIVVLFDGAKQGDSCIYKIKHDPAGKNTTLVSEVVNDGGAIIPASKEIDSGDAKLSGKFAAWAAQKFPADHYMMAFWDHGSGIFGLKNRSLPTKGFAWDDNGSHMSTKDLGPIIGAGAQAAGKPFEVVGFDACLMSHVEMAYQAKGVANYLVASEELEPGPGWDYQGWVGALSANPNMDGAGVGKAMVDSYIASYKAGGSQNSGGRETDATLACSNVNAVVGDLTPALNNLATTLSAAYGANKATLDSLRQATGTFDNTDCADLGDFLKLAAKASLPADVKSAVAATQAQYGKAVVASGSCGSPAMAKATGLVIYFPRADQSYNPVYSDASKIAFGAENWKSYLLKSHNQR